MKQEINQCEDNFLQALRTANLNLLEGFVHDKLIYNNAFGDVLTKEEDREGFKSANPKIEKVDCIEREIQVFDDTAIVTTVIYLKALFGENMVEGKTRFLRVWKKIDNNWKIIGAASINLK